MPRLGGQGGKSAGERFARRLLSAEHSGEFTQAQIQILDGAVAIAQAGVEFAFAQGEDVGADLEVLLKLLAEVFGGLQFLVGAAAAFFEGLHPEGFGDVGDGFGEAVFHQASSMGLTVLGEPRPSLVRIFSTVGRSPARSSVSAAWLTSLWVMPRGLGPKARALMY
jgi:hypothetical protein